MSLLSIVIPSRKEKYIQQTINELLSKARGDVEIIAVLEEYWPQPAIVQDPRVTLIHHGVAKGMRQSINEAVSLAKGEYIMKIDAHCMVADGYDEVLKADCQDDWVVIPRRKRLDAENWCIQDVGKRDVDYEYLSFPDNPADFGGPGLNGRIWEERARERQDTLIDENLSFQGSCWFMKKDYFYFLELMDYENYGPFWNEAQEIGFKCILSGGKVMTNKKTWYAHLHKGKKHGRGYVMSKSWAPQGAAYTKKWLYEKVWEKQTLPFDYLVEKFMPMPGWPADWKAQLEVLRNTQHDL